MFRGNAGNVRSDSGDGRELLKHYGYPGKLADEPMEKISNHEEMATAIKHQEVLRYYPLSDLVGIVLDGNVVAKKRVLNVIALKRDAAHLAAYRPREIQIAERRHNCEPLRCVSRRRAAKGIYARHFQTRLTTAASGRKHILQLPFPTRRLFNL